MSEKITLNKEKLIEDILNTSNPRALLNDFINKYYLFWQKVFGVLLITLFVIFLIYAKMTSWGKNPENIALFNMDSCSFGVCVIKAHLGIIPLVIFAATALTCLSLLIQKNRFIKKLNDEKVPQKDAVKDTVQSLNKGACKAMQAAFDMRKQQR